MTVEQYVTRQLDLEGLVRRYLTERGWLYTCGYPDACWRWEKAITSNRGTVMMTLSATDAFKLESDFLDV